MRDLFQHPVRAFAVVCVALIAIYIGWMGYRVNETLSGPGWCRTALGAEKASDALGVIKGLDACVGLLTIQLRSIATNSHILFGVMAGCLLVLVVIVIAGGKVSLDVSKTGVRTNIGKEIDALPVAVVNDKTDPVPVAAAGAPEPTQPPTEPPSGPGMPEPKP